MNYEIYARLSTRSSPPYGMFIIIVNWKRSRFRYYEARATRLYRISVNVHDTCVMHRFSIRVVTNTQECASTENRKFAARWPGARNRDRQSITRTDDSLISDDVYIYIYIHIYIYTYSKEYSSSRNVRKSRDKVQRLGSHEETMAGNGDKNDGSWTSRFVLERSFRND
jgi:hypothetical protein